MKRRILNRRSAARNRRELRLESLERRLVLDGAGISDVLCPDIHPADEECLSATEVSNQPGTDEAGIDDGDANGGESNSGQSGDVRRIGSADELHDYLLNRSIERSKDLFGTQAWNHLPQFYVAIEALSFDDGSFNLLDSPVSRALTSASHLTNVQVGGVDEGDLFKSDGDFLYLIGIENRLTIIDVRDPTDLKVASRVQLKGYPRELYLSGDRLTVISDQPSLQILDTLRFDYFTRYHQSQLDVSVYDIRDRAAPELVSEKTIDGSLVQSRAVGELVYLVMSDGIDVPHIDVVCDSIGEGEVRLDRFPTNENCRYETQEEYTTRISVDLLNKSLPSIETTSLDGTKTSEQLLSPEDIYIDGEDPWQLISTVIFDTSDTPAITSSVGVMTSNASQVYAISEHIYVAGAHWTENSGGSTRIHQFTVGDDVELTASGMVTGGLLNQFSMDEHAGYLRVATTLGWGQDATNSVYVLDAADEELSITGSVTGIAPGESIFAARFLGDRAFLVTFVRTDPVFALNLSDPENPLVVGELELPGFSSYLHPMGEDYLIGVGRDADPNSGIALDPQISLFDVGELNSPELLDRETIDFDGFAWSAGLNSHHAINFYPDLGILTIPFEAPPQPIFALPLPIMTESVLLRDFDWTTAVPLIVSAVEHGDVVTEVVERLPYRVQEFIDLGIERLPARRQAAARILLGEGEENHTRPARAESGLWVFRIDPEAENPIETLGTIDHERHIVRSIRIGDVLFAISHDTVTSHAVDNPDQQLDEVYFGRFTADDSAVVHLETGPTTIDVLKNDRLREVIKIVAVSATVNGGTVTISEDGQSVIYTPPVAEADHAENANTRVDGPTIPPQKPDFDSFTYTVDLGDDTTEQAKVFVNLVDALPAQRMAELARIDLSQRLNIKPESIEISRIEPRRWPDSCLGVHAPEQMCLTVITPGYAVWLTADVKRYEYHTDTEGRVVFAERNEPTQGDGVNPDVFQVGLGSSENKLHVLANDFPNITFIKAPQITAVSETRSGGRVTIVEDGQLLLYTPPADFEGEDSFTYTVDNGESARVLVHVGGVKEDPGRPEVLPDAFRVREDSSDNRLEVLANDFPGITFIKAPQITAVTETSGGGTVTIVNDGLLLLYTPAPGFTGRDTFSYTVDNGPSGRVTVHVLDGNEIPDPNLGDLIDVRLRITDDAGNRLEKVEIGETFFVNVFVDDLRPRGEGVFGAYFDLNFRPHLAQVAGELDFSDTYSNDNTGTVEDGQIDELGAFTNSLVPLGGAQQLLVRIPFEAFAEGRWVLTTNAADERPAHEMTLFGVNRVIDPRQVVFGAAELEIANGWHNEIEPTDVNGDLSTTPLDALNAINAINQGGVGAMRERMRASGNAEANTAMAATRMFYDVNKDGFLTAMDPLRIINRLNSESRELARARNSQSTEGESSPLLRRDSDFVGPLAPDITNRSNENDRARIDDGREGSGDRRSNVAVDTAADDETRPSIDANGRPECESAFDELLDSLCPQHQSASSLDSYFAELGV